MPSSRDIVRALRQERRRQRLSQHELALRIGVNASTIGRWEQRRRAPGLDSLVAWAEELALELTLQEPEPCPGPTRPRTRRR